ncbi:hypothetical protein AVEN_5960-1 [Araneus ventricosus]|uniref:CCHC-type domain-containing protein n=1 Tax=Araneus ventricosus TaxID=182803 RepID=A0A4Y2WII2_ARAVE|nr:hypothetical protein AVEN_5960-1 [Araneus ventricosus]
MSPSTSPVKEYHVFERFFVARRKDGSFNAVSAILIHKTILASVGEVKSVKKCNNGNLLIEVWSQQQAASLMKMERIGNYEITVAPHTSLNQSRGVISESQLQNDTESDRLEDLKGQNVIAVRRITVKRDGQLLPTKNLILTFSLPTIPKSVRIAYLNCSVRPYIPNPLRCFKCQRFGHTVQACRGIQSCARCSLPGHDSQTCSETPCCINCKSDHPAYSKTCPRWKIEKEIQTVKIKQNLSFKEARKIVMDRTPRAGVSYSAVAKGLMVSSSTQTSSEAQSHEKIKIPTSSPTKPISQNGKNMDKTRDNNRRDQTSPSKLNKEQKTTSVSHIEPSTTVNSINPSSRIPTPKTDKKEKPKKAQNTFKETKAMKKARLQLHKKNLEDKLKDSIKKRNITKQDLLKQSNYDEDHDSDGIKIHPSEEDPMSTSGEEDSLNS